MRELDRTGKRSFALYSCAGPASKRLFDLLISESICLKIIPYQKAFQEVWWQRLTKLITSNIMKDQKEPSNIKQKYHYNGRVFKKTRGGAPFFGATRHIYVSSNEKKSNKQLEDKLE